MRTSNCKTGLGPDLPDSQMLSGRFLFTAKAGMIRAPQ